MRSPFLRSIRRVLRSIASKGNPPPGDREILAHLPLHPPPSTAYTFGRLAVQLLLLSVLNVGKGPRYSRRWAPKKRSNTLSMCRHVLFRRLGKFRSDHRTPPRLHPPSRPTACSDPTSPLCAVIVLVGLAASGRGRPRLRQGHRVGFGQRCRPVAVVRQGRRA